jgi:hypothetical protein
MRLGAIVSDAVLSAHGNNKFLLAKVNVQMAIFNAFQI